MNKFVTATDYPADRPLMNARPWLCWDLEKQICAHLQGTFVPTPLSLSNGVKCPNKIFRFYSYVGGYDFCCLLCMLLLLMGLSHIAVNTVDSSVWPRFFSEKVVRIFKYICMSLSWVLSLKLDNTEVYILIPYLCTVEITTENLLQRATISWYCWLKQCSWNAL